jgi:hypothetical protein
MAALRARVHPLLQRTGELVVLSWDVVDGEPADRGMAT